MSRSDFFQSIEKRLNNRKESGNFRELKSQQAGIDFYSNDYLGLAQNQQLQQSILHKALAMNLKGGGTGSRLISGNYDEIHQLESKFATFFQTEAAIIFQSGYDANMAVLSCLPTRHDTILIDEYAHASLKEGARLSFARKISFRHNDLEDIKKKLKTSQGTPYIITESLFSMDGDFCPLPEIIQIGMEHNAVLILDEAHSTGILGPHGKGYFIANQFPQAIPLIRIHTFGKAWGCNGSVVVSSKYVIDFLVNFSLPFIYTTAPSPFQILVLEDRLNFFQSKNNPAESLNEKIIFWNYSSEKKLFQHATQNLNSPIQLIQNIKTENIKKISNQLNYRGFLTKSILSPTVPVGKERIRICLHDYNSESEISQLIEAIAEEIKTVS